MGFDVANTPTFPHDDVEANGIGLQSSLASLIMAYVKNYPNVCIPI